MKGRTTIILTDVATGRQEVHEDCNLITNAIDKIINMEMAMNRAPNNYLLPIASRALGGIMLFDAELTEDADNVHFPTEAHLVGYADQAVNTADKFRGSFNALESGKTPTGFVSVWDFGTTQANGTIKAVARTSHVGGANPLRYFCGPSGSTGAGCPDTDGSWTPIRYEGEYLYMLKGDSTGHVMRLARVRIPMLKFGVGDYSDVERSYEILAAWSTEVCTFTYYTGSQRQYSYEQTVYADDPMMYEDGHDGFIYCMFNGVQNGVDTDFGYDINYFTINYGDGSYDKSETVHKTTGTSAYGSTTQRMVYPGRYYGHVCRGVYCRMAANRKIIYQIPLDNIAAYRATRILQDGEDDYLYNLNSLAPFRGGVFYTIYHYLASGYQYLNGYLYPDGVYLTVEVAGDSGSSHNWSYMRTVDEDLCIWQVTPSNSYGRYVTRLWAANYLGTINNLITPIEKTAAQTMKIIYTLTDVEDEEEEEDGEDIVSG